MSTVSIHELIAWDLDEYDYRDSGMKFGAAEFTDRRNRAKQIVAERNNYTLCNALLDAETKSSQALLSPHAERADLQEEYRGLDWTLGVVDLRCVLAFQRRLVFDPELAPLTVPRQEDWQQLAAITLGAQRNTECNITRHRQSEERLEIRLESRNPDLQVRLSAEAERKGNAPFSLYGGSPFFEVAELHGRWFLRDGYHRAYALLRAGVYAVPAVVIRARTIDEVGAVHPWFFREEQLFSARPPRVTDFMEEDLVIRYPRQRLIKTIRIQIEESLQPFYESAIQGDSV